jgi:hypothetical protein
MHIATAKVNALVPYLCASIIYDHARRAVRSYADTACGREAKPNHDRDDCDSHLSGGHTKLSIYNDIEDCLQNEKHAATYRQAQRVLRRKQVGLDRGWGRVTSIGTTCCLWTVLMQGAESRFLSRLLRHAVTQGVRGGACKCGTSHATQARVISNWHGMETTQAW